VGGVLGLVTWYIGMLPLYIIHVSVVLIYLRLWKRWRQSVWPRCNCRSGARSNCVCPSLRAPRISPRDPAPLREIQFFHSFSFAETALQATWVLIIGYSWIDTHLFVFANTGKGWDVAWKRWVLVSIGAYMIFACHDDFF
jgi:hypothetical protein